MSRSFQDTTKQIDRHGQRAENPVMIKTSPNEWTDTPLRPSETKWPSETKKSIEEAYGAFYSPSSLADAAAAVVSAIHFQDNVSRLEVDPCLVHHFWRLLKTQMHPCVTFL